MKERGFTLVEIAIVLLVSSFIFLMVMKAYWLYAQNRAQDRTEISMDRIEAGLMNFYRIHSRYPCPARLDLPATDPQYGLEPANCTDPTFDPAASLGLSNPVTGARDTDGDAINENILIGAVPFRTIEPCIDNPAGPACYKLPLEEAYTYDGWNHKVVYVVSQTLTNAGTFDANRGVISVEDEHRQSVVLPPGSALYALISHGPNGRGAFSENGGLPIQDDCVGYIDKITSLYTMFPPTASGWDEKQNCDHNNEIILSGLVNNTDNNYYDDIVRFISGEKEDPWRTLSVAGDVREMRNNNKGFVGVGDFDPMNKPQAAFHVQGDLQAAEVFSDDLCDTSGTTCFKADFLGGPQTKDMGPGYQNTCAFNQQAITNLENNQVRCDDVYKGGIVAKMCGPTEVMIGYSNKTGVICAPL